MNLTEVQLGNIWALGPNRARPQTSNRFKSWVRVRYTTKSTHQSFISIVSLFRFIFIARSLLQTKLETKKMKKIGSEITFNTKIVSIINHSPLCMQNRKGSNWSKKSSNQSIDMNRYWVLHLPLFWFLLLLLKFSATVCVKSRDEIFWDDELLRILWIRRMNKR